MAFAGLWVRAGASAELYDFDESQRTLTIRQAGPSEQGGSSDVDGDKTPPPTSLSSPTPPPLAVYRFELTNGERTLTLTPAQGSSSADDAKLVPVVFQVTSRTDARLVLEKQLVGKTDSMDAEVITLVPDGYPTDGPGFGGEDDEDDDGEEGIDMGLDLCVVGKKI